MIIYVFSLSEDLKPNEKQKVLMLNGSKRNEARQRPCPYGASRCVRRLVERADTLGLP